MATALVRASRRLCAARPSAPGSAVAAAAGRGVPGAAASSAASPDKAEREAPLTVRSECDGVRSIILNNPRKRNVLSLAMLRSLRNDLTDDLNNPALRVIIISAVGPVFSSGHDLSELTAEYGREHHTRVFETCTEVMRTIQRLPVPVMAKVDGLATAAGCQLVASCDVALASERSRFATPGVHVGLFCSTPGVALGRSVPKKVAMEMLLTGEPISASEALAHGLLSRVVPVERLDGEVERVARSVCRLSRSVLALGKRAFLGQMSRDWDAAYALAQAAMLDNLQLPDGQEGIRAFVEKRKPQWEPVPGPVHEGSGRGDGARD
ncbi:enoyl-CoA hydratase domain-containing protein 3, mitochondrial [Lethenteron reissneri]|uniref:enoyl-CoA hydratase domain-containing protein 3, mitochondrial n=1 Tax=Lethenteron reissneri TaxID=7753 RepID=UPI002AB6B94F|nr:enoyl-CoA hydratase domain-containing protein 3, mitochondrial [Lethenteron reissneri]